MEALARDYGPKGIRFFFIYKSLAHPERSGYVQPFTLEERLLHAQEAQRTLGTTIPWLVDNMANDYKHAMGDMNNTEIVIDREGRVISRRGWSDPEALRAVLREIAGPVEDPTLPQDIEPRSQPRESTVARGVVPRLEPPGILRPLLTAPELEGTKHPFYVKLRAEAQPAVLSEGAGKVYLGFHLDPMHHVHWNNLAPELVFTVQAPEGVTVTPASGKGPKPKVEADADPREFLVDVDGASKDTTLTVEVKYFACYDADTFCVSRSAWKIQTSNPSGSPYRSNSYINTI